MFTQYRVKDEENKDFMFDLIVYFISSSCLLVRFLRSSSFHLKLERETKTFIYSKLMVNVQECVCMSVCLSVCACVRACVCTVPGPVALIPSRTRPSHLGRFVPRFWTRRPGTRRPRRKQSRNRVCSCIEGESMCMCVHV